jgi:hypothetical protein
MVFPTERKKIYICCSENDQKMFSGSLLPHLKPLENAYPVEIWSHANIKIGESWLQEIDHAIQTTIIAILLVSAHFFASDSIQRKELPLLLKARSRKEIAVVPLLFSPCDYENSLLGEFRFANPHKPYKPLDDMSKSERSRVCKDVVVTIREMLGASSSLSISSLYLSALEQKKRESINKPDYIDLLRKLSDQTQPDRDRVAVALSLADSALKVNDVEKQSLRGRLRRMRLDEHSELMQNYIAIILGLLDDATVFDDVKLIYQKLQEALPLYLRTAIEGYISQQDCEDV